MLPFSKVGMKSGKGLFSFLIVHLNNPLQLGLQPRLELKEVLTMLLSVHHLVT